MNKIFKIIGIILVIAGSAIIAFTKIPVADAVGIAIAALGLATTIVATWKKSESKTWKEGLSIALLVAGAFLLGFAGFSETVVTELITAIVGVVVLIVGLITSLTIKSTTDTKE